MVEESIHSKNLHLVDVEAQGVSQFTEWKEHVRKFVGKVKAEEIYIKTLQQELLKLTNSSNKHDDELGMILNIFATFKSSLQKSIQTVTDRVDKIEAYNLGGMAMVTGIPVKLILERKIEGLEMYFIADRLYIDGLESCINTGDDEMRVGEVIILSTQDPKAHMVATGGEGVDFGGFVCPYNILTHIQQRLKGEETFTEVVKYKK